jgi:hypothetical protein
MQPRKLRKDYGITRQNRSLTNEAAQICAEKTMILPPDFSSLNEVARFYQGCWEVSTAVTASKTGIFNCLKNFLRLEQRKKAVEKSALPAVSAVIFHKDEGN